MQLEGLLARTFSAGEVATIAIFALILGAFLFRISSMIWHFTPLITVTVFAGLSIFGASEIVRHIYLANVTGGATVSPAYLNLTLDIVIFVASVIATGLCAFYADEFLKDRFPKAFNS